MRPEILTQVSGSEGLQVVPKLFCLSVKIGNFGKLVTA